MMLSPATATAAGLSCSRSGSAAAIAGTITCRRSSGSAPGGSAAATGKPLTDDELRLIAGYPHQLALLYPGLLS